MAGVPLNSLGPGIADGQTDRTVAATNSPEVLALGTTADPPSVLPAQPASIESILKGIFDALFKQNAQILLEMKRQTYALGKLLNPAEDLEQVIPE